MSELTPPEPKLPKPPRADRRIVWAAIGSALLHAAVLVFLVWQPPPDIAQAAPPTAIEVELLPPPEAATAAEPTAEEPKEDASAESPPPAETSPAEPLPQAEPTPTEPPPTERAAVPPAAEASATETPSETAAPETASDAAMAATEPVRGLEASGEEPPIPLTRPKALTAAGSVSDEALAADPAETSETAEGTAPSAPSEQPDVATLELGDLHSAEHFYLKEMLSLPSMARARAMLETLPPEKRLLQTCNAEALAQVGNAGEGFEPDVVMAEAYARSEMTGTRVSASGATSVQQKGGTVSPSTVRSATTSPRSRRFLIGSAPT